MTDVTKRVTNEESQLMSTWFRRIVAREPGFERDVVDRFTQRLLALARVQMPERVRQRVDPEDAGEIKGVRSL